MVQKHFAEQLTNLGMTLRLDSRESDAFAKLEAAYDEDEKVRCYTTLYGHVCICVGDTTQELYQQSNEKFKDFLEKWHQKAQESRHHQSDLRAGK